MRWSDNLWNEKESELFVWCNFGYSKRNACMKRISQSWTKQNEIYFQMNILVATRLSSTTKVMKINNFLNEWYNINIGPLKIGVGAGYTTVQVLVIE